MRYIIEIYENLCELLSFLDFQKFIFIFMTCVKEKYVAVCVVNLIMILDINNRKYYLKNMII